jgi:ribosomal protein S18 acetylase RimI-like enzyme
VDRIFADEVFIIEKNSIPCALITLKKNNDVGRIGIIAVNEKDRGKNMGKQLLKAADKWYYENHVKYAEVITQKENKIACCFYEKNGYTVKSTEYVYHFWKKKQKTNS